MEKQFSYEIKKHIATLSEEGATQMQLNLVSYNGTSAKWDIRKWTEETNHEGKHLVMSKGITLKDAEMEELIKAIKDLDVRKTIKSIK